MQAFLLSELPEKVQATGSDQHPYVTGIEDGLADQAVAPPPLNCAAQYD